MVFEALNERNREVVNEINNYGRKGLRRSLT